MRELFNLIANLTTLDNIPEPDKQVVYGVWQKMWEENISIHDKDTPPMLTKLRHVNFRKRLYADLLKKYEENIFLDPLHIPQIVAHYETLFNLCHGILATYDRLTQFCSKHINEQINAELLLPFFVEIIRQLSFSKEFLEIACLKIEGMIQSLNNHSLLGYELVNTQAAIENSYDLNATNIDQKLSKLAEKFIRHWNTKVANSVCPVQAHPISYEIQIAQLLRFRSNHVNHLFTACNEYQQHLVKVIEKEASFQKNDFSEKMLIDSKQLDELKNKATDSKLPNNIDKWLEIEKLKQTLKSENPTQCLNRFADQFKISTPLLETHGDQSFQKFLRKVKQLLGIKSNTDKFIEKVFYEFDSPARLFSRANKKITTCRDEVKLSRLPNSPTRPTNSCTF